MRFCKFCRIITLDKRNSSKPANKKLAHLLLLVSVPVESKKSFNISIWPALDANDKPFQPYRKEVYYE